MKKTLKTLLFVTFFFFLLSRMQYLDVLELCEDYFYLEQAWVAGVVPCF